VTFLPSSLETIPAEDVTFGLVRPGEDARGREEVVRLLAGCGLELEADVEAVVVGHAWGVLVACAGLCGGVVKCVAIDPRARGGCLALKLMGEVVNHAMDLGRSHLFLYTKPANVALFQGCGFHPLVEVAGHACLMENTPVGLRDACARLAAQRKPGARIGCCVLNANPFTKGHLHLVRQALAVCDWVHVLVVSEDASALPSDLRLRLVREGLAGLDRVSVHEGTRYLISKGTFPSYFLKDKAVVDACGTAMDLLMFRRHIAPALGVTHRFVGTEPFCKVTRGYNQDMHQWLQDPRGEGPAVEVVEVPRLEIGGRPVSASDVRALLARGDVEALAQLVPATTLAGLLERATPRVASHV
jgi:[citrate (pro-3S)-lyase] ligase